MNAIYLYHIAHFLAKSRVPILPGLFRWLIFFLYNSVIPAQCVIGKSSLFAHGGIGVVLHPDCKIGERVMIGQGVTIGGTFGSGTPIVGSDVWIGPGVRILGDVTIGSNCIIGANAVVTRDVPDNSVVGGVPAKLLKTIEPGALDVLEGRLRNNR
jgi:serine O-acetyltransferase